MALVLLAKQAEDVASALHNFRDNLPSAATKITSAISKLYALSTVLRELDYASADPQQAPSFYRVQEDVNRGVQSMQRTLDDVLDMFVRSKSMPVQMVWDDLRHKMEQDEDAGLVERLRWYHDILRAQLDILNGYQPHELRELRREIRALWSAQQAARLTVNQGPSLGRRPSQASSPSTPRPGPSRTTSKTSYRTGTPISPQPTRPPIQRMETPISPVASSGSWDGTFPRPPVPDAPNNMPQSPTFTSSSSNTLNSSQTSYSTHDYMAVAPSLVHWSQDVFDGQNPRTPFRRDYQLQEPSVCYGEDDPRALDRLSSDGFVQALQLSFDRDELLLRLYFRPSDSRARVFIVTLDASGEERYHCQPLTNLKAIRHDSTLLLCRFKKEGRYSPWARLNFYLYERMVLFYNTFVAMKRQDSRQVSHDRLIDEMELTKPHEAAEEVRFGGVVKHGKYLHALRLFQDRGSGVVRLEACAYRGPMEHVPLWTAFITKYVGDNSWAELEGTSTVSLVALKPPPYVFLSGYHPAKRGNEYILHFDKSSDASQFVEEWNSLCRSH